MPQVTSTSAQPRTFQVNRRRIRFLGVSLDDVIRAFFGGNALVAVIVLALITYFLFREGAGFFGQNRENLQVYRQAGLEYVDIIRRAETEHTSLSRYLSDLRQRTLLYYMEEEKLSLADANAKLAEFDEFAGRFSDAVEPLRGLISDLADVASEIKTKFTVSQDQLEERRQLVDAGRSEDAAAVSINVIDFKTELQPIVGTLPVQTVLDDTPVLPAASQERMERFRTLSRDYIGTLPQIERDLEAWDWQQPVPATRAFSTFIFGKEWLTASFWQDWYGVLPLLVGSVMVSIVALTLAVPLGVGAAIYVNQLASVREQKMIKPCIEFIAAFPSVVLGFFGIIFLGEHLRALSQLEWLSWVPGFPIAERLNVLTAGCLLALLAVPTIFTLAEDALNNVPRALREASLALGATRLQTIIKIIIPAALSGIVSAVLLGFGRVIGETMVVLLCAGNRIAIPDFTEGLAAFTQPVHTMTGIIAQEMGEVARGSIHYRALFVVGIVLFFLSLAINFFAQKIVHRYRVSIG
jgi:phosphate transport system permease protein